MTGENTSVVVISETGELKFADGDYVFAYRQALHAFEAHLVDQRQTVAAAVERTGRFHHIVQPVSTFIPTRGGALRSTGEGAQIDLLIPEEQPEMSRRKDEESWRIPAPTEEELRFVLENADQQFFDTSDVRKEIDERWNDDPEENVEFQREFWKKRAPE